MAKLESQPRTAVITGASSGIGLAAAKALARQGWRVIGVGRDADRTRAAESAIAAAASDEASVTMICADIGVLANAARVAEKIAALTGRLDALFNNAGGVAVAREVTPEGNEGTFAGNHLGHFLLTGRLLPLLRTTAAASPPGSVRVVSTSSAGHAVCPGFDWNDLQLLDNFTMMGAYCQAKLANILFTRELAKRLAGDGIVVHAMHPGLVGSNFTAHGDEQLAAYMDSRQDAMVTPEEAAETLVWLATAEEPGRSTGGYFHQCAPAQVAPQGQDDDAAARLWLESEKLVARAGY